MTSSYQLLRRRLARFPRSAPVALGVALALAFASGSSAAVAASGPAPLEDHPRIPSRAGVDPATLYVDGTPPETSGDSRFAGTSDGRALYAVHCSSCHGADLGGVAARASELSSEATGGPSLRRDGGSAVDFYLRTGRMPLAVTGLQAVHDEPHFDERQILAIEAYVDARALVVPIPKVRVDRSALQRGRLLFEDNCQSCHGAGAQGATAGYQWIALPLDRATPVEIGEAIRVGPGVMPRWNERQFSAADLSAIATYVRYVVETPQDFGGSTLAYLGPVAEGLIGAILGVGTLFWVIFFTGTKADGTRL